MTDTYTPVLTDAEIECLLSFGCHPMTSVHAIGRAIERAAIKAYQKQHPPIPDGWALVPVEPTEAMVVQGFESGPDEFFSPAEEWEAFQEMSGCRQAAHKAKLCWAAMVKAAPTPPETQP